MLSSCQINMILQEVYIWYQLPDVAFDVVDGHLGHEHLHYTSTSGGTCGSDAFIVHLNVICRMLGEHLHRNDIHIVQVPLIITTSEWMSNALVMQREGQVRPGKVQCSTVR